VKAPGIVERGMLRWRLVVTVTLGLLVFGVISLFTMPRQEFPDFTIRQGLVIGVIPGATPSQVEEQVAQPVENYLFSFKEVNKKKTYSVSQDDRVVVFVELNDEVSGPDAPAFWAKLRLGLNELKAQQLPSSVVALIGNNDFGETSALLLTVEADGRSPRDMQKYLEVLESHLRRLDATASLRRYGLQKEVIRVSISRDRLARYGVRPALVFASLQSRGAMPVSNRLDGDELEMPVHVAPSLRGEAELEDIILLSEPTGNHVRLKDVASIKREYGHDDSMVRYNGKSAVVLSIEMRTGNDITRYGRQVDRAIDAAKRELPPGVQISRIADQPKVVKTSIDHFMRDFGIAIAAVILVTVLLLPARVAAVAAISIPVCIGITLGVLNALHIQLQTVSLAGLVVVLGMVVDNAIVIIDDYVERLDHGVDRWTAAWKSAQSLLLPVFTATVAIILAYVPMTLFMTGMAGDFIGSLPATVAIALLTSLLVACLLVPIMNFALIRRGIRRHDGSRSSSLLDRLQRWYDSAIEVAIRHPWLTIGAGLGSFLVALAGLAVIPQQPFPKVERSQFAIEVYLANGRSLTQTDGVVRRLETQLLGDKRVVSVTSFIGDSSPRFHTLYAPKMPARHYAQLIVNTVNEGDVTALVRENETRGRELFPEAWVRWKQLDFQPGASIEARLSGGSIAELKEAAAKVEAQARAIPGTARVFDDYEEPTPSVEIVANADDAAQLGIAPSILQTSLALGLQGFPIGTIWEEDYPVSVLLKDDAAEARTLEGLRQQYVTSPLAAATVPLEQVASVKPVWNEGAIVRRNGVRTLAVKVDVRNETLVSVVQSKLDRGIRALGLAPQIRVEYGGEVELSEEVYPPLTRAMVLSVSLIYLVLLWQFGRHRKAILVTLSMPLVVFGAVFGLFVSRYPFGMTAFIGLIGLLGIVVRNGIILVGYAEEVRREQGLTVREAALVAGKRRMRPIYLTSMAAAVGVVPMILSRSTLWGPLGAVTCFGLLFAMVLTLFVLPVAYSTVARGDDDGRPSRAPAGPVAVTAAMLALLLAPSIAHAQTGPLSLAQARALALENNSQVKESRLDVEAAEETREAAHTRYFPSVSASAVGFLAVNPLAQISTPGGNLPVYDGNPATLAKASQFAYMPASAMSMAGRGTLFALSAVQPLYAGDRVTNGNRLAELGIQVARDKAVLSRRDVLAQTEEKYWQLVVLAEKRRTLEAYEALLDGLDREVTDAVDAGLLTRNDQLKVRLRRSEATVDRQRLDSGTRLSARDLRRHIGLPEGDTIALADGLDAPEDPAALAKERLGASARRPELRLLDAAVRAEHLQTALKRGEMLPTVSVGGSVFRADIAGLEGDTNALVFGMLSVPLSGIWEGVHATESQHKRELIAERRLAETRDLVHLEIEKTWSDLQTAWSAARVSDEAVEQSEVNVKEESDRHASGLVTFSDVLEAHVLRQQALNRRVDARGEYWLKRSAFLRAVSRDDAAPPRGWLR
jgi:multidrug efflux pump subunit AcrB/outer membrane protein TolC